MAVEARNRHCRWVEILPRHWLATAHACGIDSPAAHSIIDELAEATPHVVATVRAQLPAAFPDSVSAPVLRGLETATAILEAST